MNRRNRRAGFTLPEVAMNLVLVSALSALTISVLRLAMNGYREQTTRLQASSVVDHWIQSLRTDLRNARAVEIDQGIQIDLGNNEKRWYRVEDRKLIRSVIGHQDPPNAPGRTETWNVPGRMVGVFQIDSESNARFLTCRVELFEAQVTGKPYWVRSIVFPIGKTAATEKPAPETQTPLDGSK